MNFHLGVRAVRNRHLIAMVALMGWALGAAACSSSGGSGTGGRGSGGKATGGAGGTGTGGSGMGGSGGSRLDAGAGDATDAPANNDAPITDTPPLLCIPDGGDASGDCCPDDPNKTQPGQCGCGMIDFDYDMDGIADCNDPCPLTLKPGPGVCGCGMPDVDTDNDGTLDCNDRCPMNRDRTMPGLCGCALPDTAAPSCLAHRYSFNDGTPTDGGAGGAGDGGDTGGGTTMVRDSVGTANGTAVNVVLRGTGTLTLAGVQTDQYVSLPGGIISALGDNATFEGWVNWTGAGAWQRIFDFGVADPTMPGVQGTGTSFVFLTPLGGAGGALFTVNTVGLTEVMTPQFFPLGVAGAQPHHFAAVVDASGPMARLYIDGTLVGSMALTSTLSGLQDVNNWLGRSQFLPDPEFGGTYYEFRIHSAAMTQAQITASIAAGPDALP